MGRNDIPLASTLSGHSSTIFFSSWIGWQGFMRRRIWHLTGSWCWSRSRVDLFEALSGHTLSSTGLLVYVLIDTSISVVYFRPIFCLMPDHRKANNNILHLIVIPTLLGNPWFNKVSTLSWQKICIVQGRSRISQFNMVSSEFWGALMFQGNS